MSTGETILAIVVWTPTVAWVTAGAVGHVLDRRAQKPAQRVRIEKLPTLPVQGFTMPTYNGAGPRQEEP